MFAIFATKDLCVKMFASFVKMFPIFDKKIQVFLSLTRKFKFVKMFPIFSRKLEASQDINHNKKMLRFVMMVATFVKIV